MIVGTSASRMRRERGAVFSRGVVVDGTPRNPSRPSSSAAKEKVLSR